MRRIVQLAGARAEFALADDGTIWLWTGSGWANASRGPLPETVKEFVARIGDHINPNSEKETMTLREEIDQKKDELVKELGMKPLEAPKRGRPKKVTS